MLSTIDYIKKHKFLILVILPAFFLFMLVVFPSGTYFCFPQACGINFWGVHGHDAIWHLAVANVSFNKFPFVAPTFAGENLYGYNWLFDFFVFILSKIAIAPIFSYFKLLPVVWFAAFSLLLIILGRKIKDDPLFVGLFIFFNYFAGSFSYLLTFYHHKTIWGSSTLLPQPVMHMMSNLPYAFSLIPLLLMLVVARSDSGLLKKTFIFSISVFLMLGLKFYGGVVSLIFVFAYFFFSFFPKKIKKLFGYLLIFTVSSFLAVWIFYDPFKAVKTGFPLGWAPFSLVHTVTETPDQFYLRSLTDARYFILNQGKIGPRLIMIEALNLFIFLFFYLGTRFFGFLYAAVLLLKRKWDKFDSAVLVTILGSIILTLLFVQKAEWWNTIQFFFYAIFLLTIYLSRLTFDLLKSKKNLAVFIAVLIILLSIPTSLDLVKLFAVFPGATYLSKDEDKALKFLRHQPDGVVLSPVYQKEWKNFNQPNKLFSYEDTAYISAFSNKPTYFADILQLRLTGVDFEKRLQKMQKMDCSILKEVDYVYEIRELLDKYKIIVKCKPNNFKKIYTSDKIFIYSRTK